MSFTLPYILVHYMFCICSLSHVFFFAEALCSGGAEGISSESSESDDDVDQSKGMCTVNPT